MPDKYICIHGHFYQPPRENAWLEVIESQPTAAPYHDWNERINNECYATNAAARMMDNKRRIVKIVNNYKRMSFNMGPTLLSWMEKKDPETYAAIIEADRQSVLEYDGHGSAMAQVHGHVIMPLANDRDRETQVLWGIADFEYRFGRKPEGMWLAETAADTASLEAMARNGILFTVLAPRQCKAIRKEGNAEWNRVQNESFDTRLPYKIILPSGRSIAVFFYNGNISQKIAFEGVLNDGRNFGAQLLNAFSNNDAPELVHVATDGESYGHHHRNGEMALAACFEYIDHSNIARVIPYAAYLAKFPPTFEAQIHENSSWSCVHGVERWRSNCGCHTGGSANWHQQWRAPLRAALDFLRDQMSDFYEREASRYLHDPWSARNAYVSVLLDRSPEQVDVFLAQNTKHSLDSEQRTYVLRLLEMQRNAVWMYSSCGWFFNDISGLETTQILQYACRAIEYLKLLGGADLEPSFLQILAQAPSNNEDYKTGADVYLKLVVPARVLLEEVGRHFAVASLFEAFERDTQMYHYQCTTTDFEHLGTGTYMLAMGRAHISSNLTNSATSFGYAVLYFGQLQIIGGLQLNMQQPEFEAMRVKLTNLFDQQSDLVEFLDEFDRFFGKERFSIRDLFKDEREKIVEKLVTEHYDVVEKSLRDIYLDGYQLMSSIRKNEVEAPETYRHAAQYVLNMDLRRYFDKDDLNVEKYQKILSEFKKWKLVVVEKKEARLALTKFLVRQVGKTVEGTLPDNQVSDLVLIVEMLKPIQIEPDLWQPQNIVYQHIVQNGNKTSNLILHLGEALGLDTETIKSYFVSSDLVAG